MLCASLSLGAYMLMIHVSAAEQIFTVMIIGSLGVLFTMMILRSANRMMHLEAEAACPPRHVLIVGAGEAGRAIASELSHQSGPACQVVGFVDDNPSGLNLDGCQVLGGRDDIMNLIQHYHVEEVVIAYAPTWQQKLAETLVRKSQGQVNVKIMPSLYEAMIARPSFARISDIPVLSLNGIHARSSYRRYETAKRLADIALSVIALILAAPLLLASAIAIKATSPGPVVYRQARVGRNGKLYTIYKLRTMVTDAERRTGPVLSSQNDTRVTFVGKILRKTKIDEIPQFVNVLKGDMSVVGPRPERPCFVKDYIETIPGYRERLKVRPGITGLAQVCGYYLTDPHTKLRYDLMYTYNPSLCWDLKIIILTFAVVWKNLWQ
ncbi:MAG: sugar transferase [Armatimonadetes bacterium]|nr:sugar transferase [Armatimonadota bacterium]